MSRLAEMNPILLGSGQDFWPIDNKMYNLGGPSKTSKLPTRTTLLPSISIFPTFLHLNLIQLLPIFFLSVLSFFLHNYFFSYFYFLYIFVNSSLFYSVWILFSGSFSLSSLSRDLMILSQYLKTIQNSLPVYCQ